MSSEIEPNPSGYAMIRLLGAGFDSFRDELTRRLGDTPYNDIRVSHGCVFGNIDPDGTRLTDLAERAHMTKQSVGEVATELGRLGYLERVPDPHDGRAKIIRLTERGHEAQAVGRRLIEEVERDWAERIGSDRAAVLREALEAIWAERFGAERVAALRDALEAIAREELSSVPLVTS
jgi:DNA-binding MarR family transcriptional regulator